MPQAESGDTPWEMPVAEPVDVTEELGQNDQPENRVWRTPYGYLVKIKTWQTPQLQPGIEMYNMTGVRADESGNAQVDAEGKPILVGPGHGFGLTFLDPNDFRTKADMVRDQQKMYALILERALRAMDEPPPPGVGVAT